MIFVGIDWAESHHDLCVLAEDGSVLAGGRVPEGIEGVAWLHEMASSYVDEPSEVIVGIELDRGLLVGALVAAGYSVHAINPLSVSRYRDRHRVSGAKSDPGDARVLADLVRTDRHLHREVAGDSDLAEGVKILARAHQGLIWSRQRHLNQLRSALREFYPAALEAFGTDLASPDALGVLGAAPHAGAGPRAQRLTDRRGPQAGGPDPRGERARRGDPHRAPEHPARGARRALASLRRRGARHRADRRGDDRADRGAPAGAGSAF